LDTALALTISDARYYFSHRQARNNYSYNRAGGQTATRRNNDVSQQSFWASWRAADVNYRAGLIRLERGVPGSAEFPTLQARFQRGGLWWQGAGERWRADLNLAETRFTDPEPFLNRGAIDTQDTRAHLELALGSLADQRGSWGLKPRFDYLSSDDYGDHARTGVDLHGYREQTRGRLTLTLDGGLVATEDVAVDPVARLGARYKLDATTEAFSTVGYAVRHPSFNELYYPDTGGVRGNPELDSERLLSYELGLRWTGPRARLELAGFYSDYRDSIIWAPVSAYTVEAINSGPAEVLGVEALADVELAPALWWRTAGSWLPLAEYDSGVSLTGRSEYHANSRLEYSARFWRSALSLDCTGEIPADLFGSLVIEPRALVGLELAHSLSHGEVGLTINNVLDEQARDSWNYPLPGREVYLTWRTEL
jgi:outer membrane receptor protein involved in Fe transport